MAERPQPYGMSAEVEDTIQSKYDEERAAEVCEWIMHHVPDADLDCKSSSEDIQEVLKDGVVLCNLINKLSPDSILRMNNNTKAAFKQMENIGSFLLACERYGVKRTDLFQTVNLYEGTNMPQVINGIYALGRKAAQNGAVGFGPKESVKNERKFSQEQIKSGREGYIGLQAGYNKGANQSGQNFGKTRSILD